MVAGIDELSDWFDLSSAHGRVGWFGRITVESVVEDGLHNQLKQISRTFPWITMFILGLLISMSEVITEKRQCKRNITFVTKSLHQTGLFLSAAPREAYTIKNSRNNLSLVFAAFYHDNFIILNCKNISLDFTHQNHFSFWMTSLIPFISFNFSWKVYTLSSDPLLWWRCSSSTHFSASSKSSFIFWRVYPGTFPEMASSWLLHQ